MIVNDLAELNIDASLIKQSKASIAQVKPKIIQMQNGCICCTLRVDLLKEIRSLCETNDFDYLVIESTGVAEPEQVAETFALNPDTMKADSDHTLSDIAKLDTCVTVIDSFELHSLLYGIATVFEKFGKKDNRNMEAFNDESSKDIATLLLQQIEFADVIIVNKIDLCSEKQIQEIERLIQSLNPAAKVIQSSYGQVDIKDIINTELFDIDKAKTSASWLQSLSVGSSKRSESEEYDLRSFVYKARLPFHADRLNTWIRDRFVFQDDVDRIKKSMKYQLASIDRSGNMKDFIASSYPNLFDPLTVDKKGFIARSKGFCWIGSRDDMICEWSSAGKLLSLLPVQKWFIDTEEEDWDMNENEIEEVKKSFEAPFGDRRQEIVFIGSNLDVEAIHKALDRCLMSHDELIAMEETRNGRYLLADPLPPWSYDVEEGIWRTILSSHRPVKIAISSDYVLSLRMISLDIPINDRANYLVWLKIGLRSTLLGTLCQSTRQVSLDIEVNSPYHDIEAELYLERRGDEEHAGESGVAHVHGIVTHLDHEEEEDEDETADC